MSFSGNSRFKRRGDAVDHYYRDGGLYRGSTGLAGAGAIPVKRKRLSFPASGSEFISDWYVCPNVATRGGVGDDGPAHSSGNWMLHGQMLSSSVPQHVHPPGHRSKLPEQVKLSAEEDPVFMSRDEIERCSPSRKDGIDAIRETRLRYSYCWFLQTLGQQLELPQMTIGTAIVLCHRFFVRRSHACHDRYLIATAALFLAAKSEETPRPLDKVLTASFEICHKQNLSLLPQFLPVDWFKQYRECVIEAEHMILTTLNFELNVQHPYTPLVSVLQKLGLSQTALVNMAWTLVSEGNVPICAPLGDIVACSKSIYFNS